MRDRGYKVRVRGGRFYLGCYVVYFSEDGWYG